MTPEEEVMMKKHTDQLGEHYECVLILVCRREGTGTTSYSAKYGLSCAAVGMARDYLLRDEIRMREQGANDSDEWRHG